MHYDFSNINNGLSKCKLEISDDKSYIKKSSTDCKYNSRLELQCKKQYNFYNFYIKGIKTPDIKNYGYDSDGLYFFNMEFINGQDILDTFSCEGVDLIFTIKENILNYINHLTSSYKILDGSEFKMLCIEKLKCLRNESSYKYIIDFLIEYIKHNDSIVYRKSFCHGDITLSNMIFDHNNIYVFDFLDSFINCIEIDIVKLKQDLEYLWSIRCFKNDKKNDIFRMQQVCNFLLREIKESYKEYFETEEVLVLDMINYLRIEPYVTSNEMMEVLDNIIKSTDLYKKYNEAKIE